MYTIKQSPEDFIVKEISNVKTKESGEFQIYLLKKTDYTTEKAVQTIADQLNLPRKFIGYAGNKDKVAVTEQYISIKTKNKVNLSLKDIQLNFIGYTDQPISLGDLEGNEFEIKVKNLDDSGIIFFNNRSKENPLIFPNYFGEQRFSKNNAAIGKLLIKGDFKKAIDLILETEGGYEEKIRESISNKPNDFVNALSTLPKKVLKLYIHSYQSYLFNIMLKKIIDEKIKTDTLPLIGFGTEVNDPLIKEILKKESISPRDFIIRKMPLLSSDGEYRNAFVKADNFSYEILNEKGIKLKFSLPKGCYATVLIDYLFNKT